MAMKTPIVTVFVTQACAGAGKTTQCIDIISKADKGSKPLYVVYNRKNREEMIHRLHAKGIPSATVKTVDTMQQRWAHLLHLTPSEIRQDIASVVDAAADIGAEDDVDSNKHTRRHKDIPWELAPIASKAALNGILDAQWTIAQSMFLGWALIEEPHMACGSKTVQFMKLAARSDMENMVSMRDVEALATAICRCGPEQLFTWWRARTLYPGVFGTFETTSKDAGAGAGPGPGHEGTVCTGPARVMLPALDAFQGAKIASAFLSLIEQVAPYIQQNTRYQHGRTLLHRRLQALTRGALYIVFGQHTELSEAKSAALGTSKSTTASCKLFAPNLPYLLQAGGTSCPIPTCADLYAWFMYMASSQEVHLSTWGDLVAVCSSGYVHGVWANDEGTCAGAMRHPMDDAATVAGTPGTRRPPSYKCVVKCECRPSKRLKTVFDGVHPNPTAVIDLQSLQRSPTNSCSDAVVASKPAAFTLGAWMIHSNQGACVPPAGSMPTPDVALQTTETSYDRRNEWPAIVVVASRMAAASVKLSELVQQHDDAFPANTFGWHRGWHPSVCPYASACLVIDEAQDMTALSMCLALDAACGAAYNYCRAMRASSLQKRRQVQSSRGLAVGASSGGGNHVFVHVLGDPFQNVYMEMRGTARDIFMVDCATRFHHPRYSKLMHPEAHKWVATPKLDVSFRCEAGVVAQLCEAMHPFCIHMKAAVPPPAPQLLATATEESLLTVGHDDMSTNEEFSLKASPTESLERSANCYYTTLRSALADMRPLPSTPAKEAYEKDAGDGIGSIRNRKRDPLSASVMIVASRNADVVKAIACTWDVLGMREICIGNSMYDNIKRHSQRLAVVHDTATDFMSAASPDLLSHKLGNVHSDAASSPLSEYQKAVTALLSAYPHALSWLTTIKATSQSSPSAAMTVYGRAADKSHAATSIQAYTVFISKGFEADVVICVDLPRAAWKHPSAEPHLAMDMAPSLATLSVAACLTYVAISRARKLAVFVNRIM
jgi:hypothetical protein